MRGSCSGVSTGSLPPIIASTLLMNAVDRGSGSQIAKEIYNKRLRKTRQTVGNRDTGRLQSSTDAKRGRGQDRRGRYSNKFGVHSNRLLANRTNWRE
jgi:hypothetical protein